MRFGGAQNAGRCFRFILLGTGMIAVFEPAMADPFFIAVQLQNHQVEIGSVFIALAILIFTKKMIA
jgi:hypothetical protein